LGELKLRGYEVNGSGLKEEDWLRLLRCHKTEDNNAVKDKLGWCRGKSDK
jgi:hypothetical protein